MKKLLNVFGLFLLFIPLESLYANSLSLTTGYYNIDAQVGSASGSTSDLGAFRINYWQDIRSFLSVSVGYTVLLENLGEGDSAFGMDLACIYRPYNHQYPNYSSSGLSVSIRQKWNPFVGLGFHQRQYQSIKSSYSGIGVTTGTTYDIGSSFLLLADFRYIELQGPLDGAAQEMTFNFGITFLL